MKHQRVNAVRMSLVQKMYTETFPCKIPNGNRHQSYTIHKFYWFLYEDIWARSRGYKTMFMLNSAEHEIIMLINVKMPTIVGILTFISMINTSSESMKARKILIFSAI